MQKTSRLRGVVAGILAAIFYGTNPLGSLPLYADGITPASALFYRYAIATLIFALCMLARGESMRIKWGHAIRFAFLGAFFAISSATLYESFLYMDAGIASTILFTYPIMVAALMAVVFHEHVSWATAAAIALATLGIAMLYRGSDGAKLSLTGMMLVIVSSFLYAVYIIAVNRWQTSYSPLKFTFWVVFFGLVAILAFTLVAGEQLQMLHGLKQWGCGIQLALLPTVLSLFLMNIAINNIGSTPSAIMGALEPVTAVVIGVCIFGEQFTLRLAMGILLILSGVTLIVAKKK